MKSSTPFQAAYQQLNLQQKLAVDTIEGPVMVVAGPGTGKTQILATRIANILLKTDTSPYAILALTFTESAAQNMRQRLISLIGPTAYSVHVQTFHSFCDEVLRACPEHFPLAPNSEVLSDLERYDLLEELLRNPELTALRTVNSPYHYLKSIIKVISDLKREGVNEKRLEELVLEEKVEFEKVQTELKKGELAKRKKNLAKMEELVLLYQQYQEQLRKRSRYDYDDMIAFVAEAFAREPELLLEYQEKLTYFLVDEYQDTNAAQNRVVDLLASFWGEEANIFVVGDPHQSIYRFQGASLENTLNFVERYPKAAVVTLKLGYRCPQVIYDAAAEVIHDQDQSKEDVLQVSTPMKALLEQLHDPLQSTTGKGKLIQVHAAPSTVLETIYIAEEIKKLLDKGVSLREVAILYKNNADSTEIQTALEKWQLPYIIDGGDDALQSPELQQFLSLVRVITDLRNSNEGHELFEVMNYPWAQLNHLLVMTVTRAAGRTKMSIFDRINRGYIELCKLQFCESVTAIDFAILEDFANKLVKWGQQDSEMTVPAWLEMVMKESGFLDWILSQPHKVTLLHQLTAFSRQVHALAQHNQQFHIEELLRAITTMQNHGIRIVTEQVAEGADAVHLSTVHKAKGQEWQYVFITQCLDGKWGNARQMTSLPLPSGILRHSDSEERDQNEDDRRLFYVALTRAKRQVIISYPEMTMTANRAKTSLGSMFIETIAAERKQLVKNEDMIENPDVYLTQLVTPAPSRAWSISEREWLERVVQDFKLSASSLNQYLRSPEEFIETTLLKVPQVTQPYQAFGTAVHAALEFFYKSIQEHKKKAKVSEVLGVYRRALEKEVLTKEEFQLRLRRGEEVLTQFLALYGDEVIAPLFVEKFFGYGWSATVLDDIQLTGRIDRVDLIDHAVQSVRVIDYKTGRSRTDNEISGSVGTAEFSERELELPENIRGPFKRQLLFYKLLLQLDKSFKGSVAEGIFDFVEPDRDGKFVRRSVPLLDEDVEALKELIKQVMGEIRGLEFLG